MGTFPSLTPWLPKRQTIPYPLQCTTSPLKQTSTYSGIIIIIYPLSTVSQVHFPTGLKQFASKPELLQKELSHLREALVNCKYPHRPSIVYKINLSRATGGKTTSKLVSTTKVQQQSKTPLQTLLYRTIPVFQKLPLVTWLHRTITTALLIQNVLQ